MPAHDLTEDSFGFDALKASAKDRIRDIKPSAPKDVEAVLPRIDEVAESNGFVSREAVDESRFTAGSRTRRPEPRNALNMRVPVSLGNAFQRFCEENRYSYPEGLEEIMKRAGLPLR